MGNAKRKTAHQRSYNAQELHIYKYILCSMFDLIVAIVNVDVRSKVFDSTFLAVVVVVVVDFIIMHSTYVFLYYYYCSPLDLIHTMLLIF